MSFESRERPTFKEIIDEMFRNSFKIADEIDSELVIRRYRALNRFHSLNNENSFPSEKSGQFCSKRKHRFKPKTSPI